MFCRRESKRPRAARPRLELLEPRVELSGGGNSAVARAEAVVNRLSSQVEARIEQLAARVEDRTVRFDAAYQAAMANAAGGHGGGSIGRIDQFYLALERNTGRSVDELMAQVARVEGRNSPMADTIRAADPAAAARMGQALASVGAALVGEVRSARLAAQALVAPAGATAADASTAGGADSARSALARTAQSEVVGDRANLQSFLAGFERTAGTLLSDLGAMAIRASGSRGPTFGPTARTGGLSPGDAEYNTGIAYAQEGTYGFGTAFGLPHSISGAYDLGPGFFGSSATGTNGPGTAPVV